MKNKIFICCLLLFVIGSILMVTANAQKTKISADGELNGLPVYNTHSVYAFDTSTPEKAYGASKYVFIAKVNDIIRTEYVNPTKIEIGIGKHEIVYDPVTFYSITVIKNIKGNLITTEPIELKQYGGISKDKKSYLFEANSSYLNLDGYYMFLTGAEENGGVLEATNPNRMIYLGDDLELIKNVEEKKIQSQNIENKTTKELVSRIENYLFIEKEIEPTRFNDNMDFPVLDNISKYDVNYLK